jgi:hypothetical protein
MPRSWMRPGALRRETTDRASTRWRLARQEACDVAHRVVNGGLGGLGAALSFGRLVRFVAGAHCAVPAMAGYLAGTWPFQNRGPGRIG